MVKTKYKIHEKNYKKIMLEPRHKILVPVDCSKNSMRGVNFAISLVKSSGGSITELYVEPSRERSNPDMGNFFNEAELHAKRYGVSLRNEISIGSAGPEIINYAKNNKFDLIVMGARGFSKVKKLFLGSVSNFVLHSSKIPVMIVK
jgi:nucleotide-binding universal stress UspA family protein